MNAKPFIKWAGGKTQLLPEIRSKYPENISRYCEPFVGGGAVLLDILQTFHPQEVLINDINPELMNSYSQIKDNCEELIHVLSRLQKKYTATPPDQRKALYLEKREEYNTFILGKKNAQEVKRAALFIFLNKTCFNGLYRVNMKGCFNVPFNYAVNPLICDAENLRLCSSLLENVQMRQGDYSLCSDFIDADTFVYLDPPYRPLTKTASFTSYNEKGFDDTKQIELCRFIAAMSGRGARIVASNSDPKNVDTKDNFFDELYSDFNIERIHASRMINSNAKRRGAVNELLISNVAVSF